MISVKDLSKRYARNTAVDHISFEVERGQIVGFLGPNGAGKTTTMRILTCFLPPSSGTATVAGFDVLEAPLEVKKRKLVATDSVNNLQSRARGAELVVVEVAGRNGALDSARVQERLEKVAGVGRVAFKEKKQSGATFEVESLKDKFARGDLARAIVEAGWDLNELRTSAVSLEEIFLQLTGEQVAAPPQEAQSKEAGQ